MTKVQDAFTHGSEYLEYSLDEPRTKCCNSCAFTNKPETVRPKDISLKELEDFAVDLDVFYCHNKEDGSHKICAKWFALVEGDLSNLNSNKLVDITGV